VRRELQYHEGDAWNPESVKKTFACLKDLEIFDSIQLYPAAESANEVEKTMILKLHHDDPYEIRARAGIELQYIQEYRTFGALLINWVDLLSQKILSTVAAFLA